MMEKTHCTSLKKSPDRGRLVILRVEEALAGVVDAAALDHLDLSDQTTSAAEGELFSTNFCAE